MSTSKPVYEKRMGCVKALVWANNTNHGVRYNVTIARLHKAGTDWRTSGCLGRDDLPLAIKVLDDAHSWFFEQGGPQPAGAEE